MAHLVKPWIVRWVDKATGQRVPTGTPGAKKVKERARKWYGVGVPGKGTKRVSLATDKSAARRMLDDLVRRAEQGNADLPDRDAARTPLKDHLPAFEEQVRAGLADRSKKKNKKRPNPKQAKLALQRVKDILTGCRLDHVGDLNDDAPAKLAAYLQARVDQSKKDGGFSHQTAVFYLAAARRFVWWLSKRKKVPVRIDLFDDVPGFDPDNNREHARRNITPDELARVLEAARGGEFAEGLSGEDRYFLYLLAFGTGFRASELASLKPEAFALHADRPSVRLSGKVAKNRKKTAEQFLTPGVAHQLVAYLATKKPGEPVWPGKWTGQAARMLRVDLAAAGIPYSVPGVNGPEYADFHALRHSFITALADQNVSPKVLQELARHSTARLTLERYTHTDRHQLAGAVALLPIGGTVAPLTREQLVAGLIAAQVVLNWLFGPAGATGSATGSGQGTQGQAAE